MKIGDRIIYKGHEGIIIDIYQSIGKRYLIQLFDQYNVTGGPIKTWVNNTNISLDIQYYRDLQLNKLLKS